MEIAITPYWYWIIIVSTTIVCSGLAYFFKELSVRYPTYEASTAVGLVISGGIAVGLGGAIVSQIILYFV